MSLGNQEVLNVDSNIESGNQRLSDVNSDVSSEHQQMSKVRTCMNELIIKQEANFQLLLTGLHDFQQEVQNKFQDVNKKQEKFFETMFNEHRKNEIFKSNIKLELDDFHAKQREFFLEKSTQHQNKLRNLNKITIEFEDITSQQKELLQKATTENKSVWRAYEAKLTMFEKNLSTEILVLHNNQKDFQKQVNDQLIQMQRAHGILASEIKTLISKLEELVPKTSTVRLEIASEQSKHLNELQKNFKLEITYLKEKQHSLYQEYKELVEHLLSAQHSYNTHLQRVTQNQNDLQTQFASLVASKVGIGSGISSLTEKVVHLTDYQSNLISNLKKVSEVIQRSDESLKHQVAIQNRISCDFMEFSEKQTQFFKHIDRINKSQNNFTEQQEHSRLIQQEEISKVVQKNLMDQLLKLQNNMRGELGAVSEKLMREQDVKFNTLTEKLYKQYEKFGTVQEIVAEQQQQHLASFQDFSRVLKGLSEKQQLQLFQQDEKLQYVQNIVAEQQQNLPIKLQVLFENQLSQQENKFEIIQKVLAEHKQEQQMNLQKILNSELKALSEKQQSQMFEYITTIAEQQQVLQALKNQPVDMQSETNIQLKEVCDQIEKSVSAIQKKLEGVETKLRELTEGPDFESNHSQWSENQNFSSASSVGQGNYFMGDVVVGGHIIGQVNMKEVFEENKTLQHAEIQNIDNRKILYLQKVYKNRKTKVVSQETMTDHIEPKEIRSLGTMTEIPNLERRTGSRMSEKTKSADFGKNSEKQTGTVVQHHNVEETIVVLGGVGCSGVVESYSADCNTWATEDNISDGPDGETVAVTVGDVIVIFEVDNKKTRSLNFVCKRWTDLPSPPVYREGMRAAANGSLVYLTGGWQHLFRCDVYDLQSNQWSEGPKPKVGRRYHGSATLAGKIYCCGGRDEKWKEQVSTEMFDPKKEENEKWTSVADMNVKRLGLGLASCSRFLWAVGGWEGSCRLTSIERYDPVIDIWTKMACMRVGKCDLSVCFFSGKLYAIGGLKGLIKPLNSVEAYDPEKNEWTQVAPLNQNKYRNAACVVQLPSA